jgi:hypothetical protein
MFLGMFVRLGEKSDIAARARHAEREIDIVLETAGKKKEMTV